ncbi:Arc family DNA-binding protein [Ochrobactrum daejeonense]|nr:Arc family DNA-binding protein [Brucella daejeonensis]
MAKSSSPAADLDKVIVRLPDGMRDQLKSEAKENNRSLNAEIVARLERYSDEIDIRKKQRATIDQLWAHLGHIEQNKNFYRDLLVLERRNSAHISIILDMLVDLIYKEEDKIPDNLIHLAAKLPY